MSKAQAEVETEKCDITLKVCSLVPVPSSLFVSRSNLASEQRADPTIGGYFDQLLSDVDGKVPYGGICCRTGCW